MTSRLDTVADKVEIQELESRYAWAVDEGRLDSLAELFTEDARLSLNPPGQHLEGRAAILAWFRGYCEEWGWQSRRHYITNLQVEVNGSTAAARAYFLLTYETHQRSRIGWGNYDDRFVKAGGRWWIVEKRITVAGPVSLDKGWAGLELPPSAPHWR